VDVKGSYLTASFTASVDFQRVSNETIQSRLIGVSAKAKCSEYEASLMEFVPTPLSDNFKGAVNYLATLDPAHEQSGYNRVIEAFGTHFTSVITMGAECTLQSLITQESYSSLVQSGFSVSAGASASFLMFTGGASFMTDQQIQQAKTYDSSRLSLFESYLGSHPSTDGKWQTWAQTVADSPYPFEYTLTPLATLLTQDNFPNYNTTKLAFMQQKLTTYITQYCSVIKGASCSGPKPDLPPIYYEIVSNSGAGDFYATCPLGYSLLGTGFQRKETSHESFPGYLYDSSTRAHCYDYFGAECFGTCTNAFKTSEVWIGTSTGTTVTVNCPQGYLVAGCAMQLSQTKEEGYPYAYMTSQTSCACYDYFGVTCQAACVPASSIQSSYEIKSNYGTGIVEAVCPEGKQVMGCGYKPQTGVSSECCWYVYPSTDRCTCYDYFGVTCYATCANIYNVT
jgi:hypothetical protein